MPGELKPGDTLATMQPRPPAEGAEFRVEGFGFWVLGLEFIGFRVQGPRA